MVNSSFLRGIVEFQEALKNEIANQNATKDELSHTETEAEKLVDYINNMNKQEEHRTSKRSTEQP